MKHNADKTVKQRMTNNIDKCCRTCRFWSVLVWGQEDKGKLCRAPKPASVVSITVTDATAGTDCACWQASDDVLKESGFPVEFVEIVAKIM